MSVIVCFLGLLSFIVDPVLKLKKNPCDNYFSYCLLNKFAVGVKAYFLQ